MTPYNSGLYPLKVFDFCKMDWPGLVENTKFISNLMRKEGGCMDGWMDLPSGAGVSTL